MEVMCWNGLVALNKNPGVRPIGVGEVLRRIVAKAILKVERQEVQEACGYIQKCAGLPEGIEVAVHPSRNAGYLRRTACRRHSASGRA